MSHPLDSLVFITIPEEHHLSTEIAVFDPSIPLPVQLTEARAQFEASELSWEMILAGILTVLAYDTENTQLEYYRSILISIRPGIREEMTEAAILKVRNGDFEMAEEIFLALRGLDPDDRLTILNLALLMDERADNMRRSGLDEDADAFDAIARLPRERLLGPDGDADVQPRVAQDGQIGEAGAGARQPDGGAVAAGQRAVLRDEARAILALQHDHLRRSGRRRASFTCRRRRTDWISCSKLSNMRRARCWPTRP